MARVPAASWTLDRVDPVHEIMFEPLYEVNGFHVVWLQWEVEFCCVYQR